MRATGVYYKILMTAVIVLAALAGSVQAQPVSAKFTSGEVLIKFKPTTSSDQVQTMLSEAGLQQIQSFPQIGVILCRITKNTDVQATVAECQKNPAVEYAEPNYLYHIPSMPAPPATTPNDPRFNELWGLRNSNDADIDADEAWDIQKGSSDIIVGVIDTGIDYDHPDLSAQVWHNPGESGGGKENNGVDDDNNGYVDDYRGWNFQGKNNDPYDDQGHGTHVSGTIGAVGDNGIGVVGVNWHVRIMALKFLDRNGSGSLADAIPAILYAADMGARVTSNSWGGGGFSQSLKDAIEYARDKNCLFIAAAGNDGKNTDLSDNYPSNYDVANVISVAASDRNDRIASFSNFGRLTVDLAAPGVDVLSTQPDNKYQTLSGTSMATPHVSGVCALVLAQYPGLTYRQVLTRVLGGVDYLSEFSGLTLTGGRLNAAKALSTDPRVFIATIFKNTPDTSGPYSIAAEALDDGSVAGVKLMYSLNGGATVTVDMTNTGGERWEASIPGQPMNTQISYLCEATDDQGNTSRSRTVNFKISNEPDEVQPPGQCCGQLGFTLYGGGNGSGPGQVALAIANLLFLVLVISLFRRWRRVPVAQA